MKLEQLSGANVLRRGQTVNKKNSAPAADNVPPVDPAAETLRYKGKDIPVRAVTEFGGEGADAPRRSWTETLCQSRDGKLLFLVRDSWRGRMGDSSRRRHVVKIRRIGKIGALLWTLGHTALDPRQMTPATKKLARQFWLAIGTEAPL